jgi:5-formyltetrahydrofolate cyclo-ligase
MAIEAEELLRRRVKAEIRKRMRALRASTPLTACAERSARIVCALEEMEVVRAARAVALFWPIEARHEVDLRALDASLRSRGVRVAYPAIEEGREALVMRFALTGELEERGHGFHEPPAGTAEARPGELDVIVAPALAVDPAGHRIGYGAGWYDRTLPFFTPPAASIAVAFDYQLVAEVAATPEDVPVHWVVTDARVLRKT